MSDGDDANVKWYAEERTAMGRWVPVFYAERPSEVGAEGARKKLRNVRKVPEKTTLDQARDDQ